MTVHIVFISCLLFLPVHVTNLNSGILHSMPLSHAATPPAAARMAAAGAAALRFGGGPPTRTSTGESHLIHSPSRSDSDDITDH
jgi:hypothetical protein